MLAPTKVRQALSHATNSQLYPWGGLAWDGTWVHHESRITRSERILDCNGLSGRTQADCREVRQAIRHLDNQQRVAFSPRDARRTAAKSTGDLRESGHIGTRCATPCPAQYGQTGCDRPPQGCRLLLVRQASTRRDTRTCRRLFRHGRAPFWGGPGPRPPPGACPRYRPGSCPDRAWRPRPHRRPT